MMDKRSAWREQEQQLVARWSAAAAHYREVYAESLNGAAAGDDAASKALQLKVERARAEIETLRREVARLKVAFSSGKRY